MVRNGNILFMARMKLLELEMEKQLAAVFQLEDLRAGTHIVRDHRNWKVAELKVEYLWWSLIEPSFDPPALLAVVRFEDELLALFQPLDDDRAFDNLSTIKLSGWRDPMLSSFEDLNIMTQVGGLVLDGIGYHLHIMTGAVDAHFSFSNPDGEGLRRVQSVLVETAGRVVEVAGDGKLEAYLARWREYVEGE